MLFTSFSSIRCFELSGLQKLLSCSCYLFGRPCCNFTNKFLQPQCLPYFAIFCHILPYFAIYITIFSPAVLLPRRREEF